MNKLNFRNIQSLLVGTARLCLLCGFLFVPSLASAAGKVSTTITLTILIPPNATYSYFRSRGYYQVPLSLPTKVQVVSAGTIVPTGTVTVKTPDNKSYSATLQVDTSCGATCASAVMPLIPIDLNLKSTTDSKYHLTYSYSGDGNSKAGSGDRGFLGVGAPNSADTAWASPMVYAVGQPIPFVFNMLTGDPPYTAGSMIFFLNRDVDNGGTNPQNQNSFLFAPGGSTQYKFPLTGAGTPGTITLMYPGTWGLQAQNGGDNNNYGCTGGVFADMPSNQCELNGYFVSTTRGSFKNIRIVQNPTITTVNPPSGTVYTNQNVSLSATVTQSNANVGTVTFFDGTFSMGSAPVGSGGVAALTAQFSTAGNHSVTAKYSGDYNAANTASTSTAVTVAVSLYVDPNKDMSRTLGYDAKGNLTQVADAADKITLTSYNRLDQPVSIVEPLVGQTTATTVRAFNAQGGLTSVRDDRSNTTSYTRDGLGQGKSTASPDAGTQNATYNAAGQVATRTDARGKVTTYTYDDLGRVTQAAYATGTASSFEYDGGASPTPANTGELTKVVDESGQTTYSWNTKGQLLTKQQTTNAKVFDQSYVYGTSAGAKNKLANQTYPGYAQVNYSYDSQGRISGITVNPVATAGGATDTSSTISVLSSVTYDPEQRVSGWTWGDGTAYVRSFDQFGRLTAYPLGSEAGTGTASGVLRTVNYNSNGLPVEYKHTKAGTTQSALDQTFSYDAAGRVVSATLSGTSYGYGYDSVHNRVSEVVGATTYTDTIASTSNRLTVDQSSAGTRNLTYDAAGHVLSDGNATYAYSDRGRMASATVGSSTVSYKYNGLEQRVWKSGPTAIVSTGQVYYVYDGLAGNLIGEYDANLIPVSETVYLGDIPVAVLKYTRAGNHSYTWSTALSFVYADHLNAPRVIVRNSDHAIQWRWDQAEPFGSITANQNPNSLGTFTFDQRFPGQVYDAETGNFYNWYRDYSPRFGRYAQSDPIGLNGGINTYAYVGGNPLSFTDPKGLSPKPDWWNKMWAPPETSKCVTAECAGGLLPAPPDNRTDAHQQAGMCRLVCTTIGATAVGACIAPGLSAAGAGVVSSLIGGRTIGTIGAASVCRLVCE